MWNSWIVQYKEEPKTVFTVRSLIVHILLLQIQQREAAQCVHSAKKKLISVHFCSVS